MISHSLACSVSSNIPEQKETACSLNKFGMESIQFQSLKHHDRTKQPCIDIVHSTNKSVALIQILNEILILLNSNSSNSIILLILLIL